MKQTKRSARIFLAALLVLVGVRLHAQPLNFAWALSMGGNSPDDGGDIAVDASGNVYSIGFFEGTADFDPGAGTCIFTSTGPMGQRDMYVSKLDASGNFVWAKQIAAHSGNTYGYKPAIAIDANGDVVYTGIFRGTVDFDPGAGITNLTTDTYFSIFICKLSSAGNFIWVKEIEGFATQVVCGLEIDASGNIYTAGYYGDSTDFDPGAGTYNLGTSQSCFAAFVCKLNSSGNFVWAKRIGGTNAQQDIATAIALDATGNVYITGAFDGTEDFDPGAATFNLVAPVNFQCFVLKLDNNGNFVWATQTGGSTGNENMRGWTIAVDGTGNVYYCGDFTGGFDFDPGAGTTVLGSGTHPQVFISELNSSGGFVWAKTFAGPAANNLAASMAIDAANNIYIAGHFTDSLDFDPGAGVYFMDATFLVQTYFCKLTSTGNFIWAKRFENGNSYAKSMTLDANGSLYLTGQLGDYWTVDFDPGPAVHNLPPATGFSDAYVCKFSPADLSVFDQDGINNLLVYPNPANSVLNIKNRTTQKTNLVLYNMVGELINTYVMEGEGKQIDVSELPNGMYLLITESGEGRTITKVQVAH